MMYVIIICGLKRKTEFLSKKKKSNVNLIKLSVIKNLDILLNELLVTKNFRYTSDLIKR